MKMQMQMPIYLLSRPFHCCSVIVLLLMLGGSYNAVAQQERPVDSTERQSRAADNGTSDALAPAREMGASAKGMGGIQMQSPAAPEMRFQGSYGKVTTSFAAGRNLGATVGGAKDIGYARQIINAGGIPRFLDFSPEGLYSEHDIPTPSDSCNDLLCLSLGYGYAPTVDNSSNALFLHLGLNSNIKADQFRRDPLRLAVVVDRSGSMSQSMPSVRKALHALVAHLRDDDQLTLITFNTAAEMVMPATALSARGAIDAAIDKIVADGGTDVAAGMRLGYSQLESMAGNGGMKRLMLFTDEQPNAGDVSPEGFIGMIRSNSQKGIGLTMFGIGDDFGAELAGKISSARGANFFFLDSPERIATVFDKEFDYLVTPIVYDLVVHITTPRGLRLKEVYGLPGWTAGSPDAELAIPTVFLSSNRGAIILRYERDGTEPLSFAPGDALPGGTLSYRDPMGTAHRQEIDPHYSGIEQLHPGTQFYTHDGMRMAVALTNIFFALRDASIAMTQGKQQQALDVITRGKGEAMLENLVLNDDGLAREIALLEKLADNIRKGTAVRTPQHEAAE